VTVTPQAPVAPAEAAVKISIIYRILIYQRPVSTGLFYFPKQEMKALSKA
jgi:hypothetical protein